MLGEPIAGAAGLTLWHRPNQGDPARVTCWEEFQYLNALSTGKLKTKGCMKTVSPEVEIYCREEEMS